jgi:two-component system NarL family response regulator
MSHPIPVSIIHGSGLVREGIVGVLNREPRVRVTGSFGGAAEALARAGTPAPAVVLYDLDTMRRDDPSALPGLRDRMPGARVLIFGVAEQDQDILDCVRAAAAGCVLDTVSLDDLVESIHAATAGTTVASPRVVASLFDYVARAQARDDQPPPAPLTPREEQILQLIAEGLDNREIAKRLYLQPQTVKNYVHLVLQKLNLGSRLDVIRYLRAPARTDRRAGAPSELSALRA